MESLVHLDTQAYPAHKVCLEHQAILDWVCQVLQEQ